MLMQTLILRAKMHLLQEGSCFNRFLIQVEMYRTMWEKAIDEILQELVMVNSKGIAFFGQRRNKGMFSARMEHLACYLPGNMALGVAEGAVESDKGIYYLEAAANLTKTCFDLYNDTATGRFLLYLSTLNAN